MADLEAPGLPQTSEGAPGTPQAAAKVNGAAGEVGPAMRKGSRAKGSAKVPGSGEAIGGFTDEAKREGLKAQGAKEFEATAY